jgi:hypothetical protein
VGHKQILWTVLIVLGTMAVVSRIPTLNKIVDPA